MISSATETNYSTNLDEQFHALNCYEILHIKSTRVTEV